MKKMWTKTNPSMNMPSAVQHSNDVLPSAGTKHFVDKPFKVSATPESHFDPTELSTSELPNTDKRQSIEKGGDFEATMPPGVLPTPNKQGAGWTPASADVAKKWTQKNYDMSDGHGVGAWPEDSNLRRKWGQ